jgi:hypothetical protein
MFKKLLNRGQNMQSSKSGPAPLATLDAGDLRRFREQRKVIADQARLLAMLQVCYNTFLTDVRAKYSVPENISVNIQTGEIREIQPEKTDG